MISKSLVLPDCHSSPPFDNCVDTYKYSSGSTYSGECMNGQRHERGSLPLHRFFFAQIIFSLIF
jgi:hypothetical protein